MAKTVADVMKIVKNRTKIQPSSSDIANPVSW